MKILLTNYDMSVFGGTERMVANLANLLSDRGHEVILLSFHKQNDPLPYRFNEKIQIIFAPRQRAKSRWIPRKIWSLLLLWRHFVTSYRIGGYGCDAVIAHDFAEFIPYYKNPKTRYIKVVHGNYDVYAPCHVMGYFDDVVILSHSEMERWKERFSLPPPLSAPIGLHCIPNFLCEIPRSEPCDRQKIILSVGRLVPLKGFLRLLDIWAILQDRYPKWKLHIVGEGVLEESLKHQIKEKNLSQSVVIKPFTQEIQKEYLQASIYAMCSHHEGFPMVLLEASSQGLPIVAFDISTGPAEIIEDRKSGFLVQDGDLEGFAQALGILMSDEDMRRSFGERGRLRTSSLFSQEAIYAKWDALLRGSELSIHDSQSPMREGVEE